MGLFDNFLGGNTQQGGGLFSTSDISTSNQYDYSKKNQISKQTTYAPVTTTTTTTSTNTTNAQQYNYAPQIAYNSAGATQSSKKADTIAGESGATATPYISTSANPNLAPQFTTPSTQSASPSASSSAGLFGMDSGMLLLFGALAVGAFILLKD